MNMTEKHGYGMFSTSDILTFHVGTGETLFFEKWLVSQDKQFLVTCVAVFLLAFFHEGLKALVDYIKMSRDQVYAATPSTTVRQSSEKDNTEKTGNTESMGHEPRSFSQSFCAFHVLHSFLYMSQMFTAYTLMIIFMTLNVWLCALVCLGTGIGVLLFRLPICPMKSPSIDSNENDGKGKD